MRTLLIDRSTIDCSGRSVLSFDGIQQADLTLPALGVSVLDDPTLGDVDDQAGFSMTSCFIGENQLLDD